MKKIVFVLLLSMIISPVSAKDAIKARVNDDIISDFDFEQRLKLLELTNHLQIDQVQVQKKVLDQMIDEKLKFQEMVQNDIIVSEEDVNKAVNDVIRQNKLDPNELRRKMSEKNLPMSLIEDQIRCDMGYARSIRKKFGFKALPTEEAIDLKLDELKDQAKLFQFEIGEIVLPFKDSNSADKVYAKAVKLIMRMRDGETFEAVAKSQKMPNDGYVGWVTDKQINKEIFEVLEHLQPGQLSKPIKTKKAYHLVVLINKKNPISLEEQEVFDLAQMIIPNEKKLDVEKNFKLVKGSCERFSDMAKEYGYRRGMVPLNNLPSDYARIIERLDLLNVSNPISVPHGSLYLMVCQKKKMVPLPSREQIKEQLENDYLEREANRYFVQLRRIANIEVY
ncbi:MAG: peptidylprolyl isomerase [Alphaproteobacteria bacterium]|nr:peptidylprolyl isomerase [Alphaproteobacteria bacterium]